MEAYDLLIQDEAVEVYLRSRGAARQRLRQCIDGLANDPFQQPEHTYQDRKGRLVHKYHTIGYVIDCIVDHAVKEVKVLEITPIS